MLPSGVGSAILLHSFMKTPSCVRKYGIVKNAGPFSAAPWGSKDNAAAVCGGTIWYTK